MKKVAQVLGVLVAGAVMLAAIGGLVFAGVSAGKTPTTAPAVPTSQTTTSQTTTSQTMTPAECGVMADVVMNHAPAGTTITHWVENGTTCYGQGTKAPFIMVDNNDGNVTMVGPEGTVIVPWYGG